MTPKDRLTGRFRPAGYAFVLLCAVACAPGITHADEDNSSSPFTIRTAEWQSRNQVLVVRGRGTRRESVIVGNAGAPSIVLGDTTVDRVSWTVRARRPSSVPCRVRAAQSNGQSAEANVRNAPADCDDGNVAGPPPDPDPVPGPDPDPGPAPGPVPNVSINSTGANGAAAIGAVAEQPLVNTSEYRVLAANDLGMHCADLDYQIFSILPPFNVVHAQVIQRGTENSLPSVVDATNVEVVYSAASNPDDPALNNPTLAPIFKTNFWDDNPASAASRSFGFDTYAPLYFGLLPPAAVNTVDVGLPVPDSVLLPIASCLNDPACLAQAKMPGLGNPFAANEPQHFDRFDHDFNFFNDLLAGLGLGGVVTGVNWWAADGIPIMPIDDQGRSNAYPLMRVQARRNNGTEQVLASTDVVLPVASEADCQLCHAAANEGGSNGAATDFASVDFDFVSENDAVVPGPEKLLNAAKMNVLRLHDAKHGAQYVTLVFNTDGSVVSELPAPCDTGTEDSCLANSTPVQCATCHYTPALDLAQLGPTDTPDSTAGTGLKGTQQTRHITMSRAMHGHHGDLMFLGEPLFPDMPAPLNPNGSLRNLTVANQVLEDTCYQCHPGKRTQCLRGAMASGGVVCQDCHGQMRHVGDDFSENLASTPFPGGADFDKRVPWASEPGCQSCHTGDALNKNHPNGAVVAPNDEIRLLQAYVEGDETATPIVASASRFAENESLYRLSGNADGSGKGHGGIMCEGCHGSTHAIWPNALAIANDNVTAGQLQGHSGTIIECDTCHAPGSLGLTLNGPHGMHPVGDSNWNSNHEDVADSNADSCRACHGVNGEGTVLSRMAATRTLECDDTDLPQCDNNDSITLEKGTQVSCTLCHENEL